MELYFSPPYFLNGGGAGTGAVSALRSFRLFRIFAGEEVEVHANTFEKVLDTTYSMGPFLVLLVLFMYIYTLLGMSFLVWHFDENEYQSCQGEQASRTHMYREKF